MIGWSTQSMESYDKQEYLKMRGIMEVQSDGTLEEAGATEESAKKFPGLELPHDMTLPDYSFL
jgi:hypothetical protein